MRKLIVGNWKMNPESFVEAERLAKSVFKFANETRNRIVLCPPFVWLTDLSHKYRREVYWGAQDIFWEGSGAFTGEVSPLMLKNSGVQYVIIGHSERRKWLGETDEMVNKKVLSALRAGLKVILCVGEPLAVRRKGLAAAKKFVAEQLRKDLRGVGKTNHPVVTYEPIWAISSGKIDRHNRADNPKSALEMIVFVKKLLTATYKLRAPVVIYGGSVTSKNAAAFLCYNEIDGALVGGASLNEKDFKKIINISSKL